MAHQRTSEWIGEVVSSAISETFPPSEMVKWDLGHYSIPRENGPGVETDPFCVLWISVDHGDDVYMHSSYAIKLFSVTEKELRDHITSVWQSCVIERWEPDFEDGVTDL